MNYEEFLQSSPFQLNKEEKTQMLTRRLVTLTENHIEHCELYNRMMQGMGLNIKALSAYNEEGKTYYDLPFLPVRLFKQLELKSISDEEIHKTMTSSGTTGQAVSRIYCDKVTAGNQQKTLVRIVSEFTGSTRMPMLIIDCPSVVKNRAMFSARGAGILGFSIFGANRTYALDDEMNLAVDAIEQFLNKHQGKTVLLFGFTFMVWEHFYKKLCELQKKGKTFDLSNAILIHGGGWKKLASEAVESQTFKDSLKKVCGISRIHDYYGMVEQTGCIYMECECGHLHASIYSDVIVRRTSDFSVADIGEKGIIQVVSVIPESYPGHSLLTEDQGVILGEDDCPCGRLGKYFKVIGRLKNAEIRGCSDTYAADFRQR